MMASEPKNPPKVGHSDTDDRTSYSFSPKWTKYHIAAFTLTFFSNILLHIIRKSFTNVKKTISEVWSPFNTSFPEIYGDEWNGHQLFPSDSDASIFLGTLDTIYMLSHSAGLFVSGAIGDRFDLRKVLSIGICSSAVTVLFFGYISEILHIYRMYWYIIFWCLTGLLQSSEWPVAIAILGNWYGKSRRGLVMGIWAASPAIGNVLGAYVTAAVLNYGYQFAFLVPAGIAFAGGITIYFSLIPSPREVGLPNTSEEDSNSDKYQTIPEYPNELGRPIAIGFFDAICLPGVIPYSISYACMKLLHVSFMFWLPYYIQNTYGWQETKAVKLSIWYDIGGILGAISVGYISDKIKLRSPVIAVTLLLAPFVLFALSASTKNLVMISMLLILTGLCINGVASLMCTTIAADLGNQEGVAGNREAMATVTGIIDGTGSAGAAVGQQLIPMITRRMGWKFVFYLFMILAMASLSCITKMVYRDVRELWRKWKLKSDRAVTTSSTNNLYSDKDEHSEEII